MVSVRIQAKFLILVLSILLALFGLFSFVVIRHEAALLTQKNAEQEHLLATMIVADLKDNMLAGRPRSTLKLMESIRGAYGLTELAVLRGDGRPAFGEPGDPLALSQVGEVFRTGRMIDLNVDGLPPRHINLFPLPNEGSCRRCHRRAGDVLGVILVSHSLEDAAAELRANKRQLLFLFSAALLAIGAALYAAVSRVVLRPLRELHHGAEVIAAGDFTQRIAIRSGDEFQDLASAFNDMAGMLRETYAGLEAMVQVRTAELSESVRLIRGILSSMSSGVVLLTPEGVIKLINRQGAWILGRGHDDLVGLKLEEVVPETAAFRRGRVGSHEELAIRTPAGLSVPIGFTSAHYTGSDGQQEGLIVVFQDLTEIKMLHAELVNKERFASMGRVVSGVAHEIRNPLFGISAIGQLLERDLTRPEHQELVRALLAEAKRLNQLVEELLIYGRPMKLKLEDADLQALWNEVLDLHRDELGKRGIAVVTDNGAGLPGLRFDPHQVRQVLLNLLRNAMEAMQDGGEIATSLRAENGFAVLRISDTGAGIPREQLAHVFDLFFTTKPKGTGLGLAICRKIMEDHGGDISLESESGTGTLVTVRLPAAGGDDRTA